MLRVYQKRGWTSVCGDVITEIREVLPIKKHMRVDGVNCNKLYITLHSSNVIAVTLTIVYYCAFFNINTS